MRVCSHCWGRVDPAFHVRECSLMAFFAAASNVGLRSPLDRVPRGQRGDYRALHLPQSMGTESSGTARNDVGRRMLLKPLLIGKGTSDL